MNASAPPANPDQTASAAQPSPTENTSRRLRRALSALSKRARTQLAMAVVLGSVGAVILVVQMAWLARLINDLAFSHHGFALETRLAFLLMVAACARALVQCAADAMADKAALKITGSLRLELLGHLFRAGPVALAREDSGALATALSEGVEALGPYFARYIPRAAAMTVLPLLILAVVFHVDTTSFIVLAVTGPLVPLFMALVGYGAQAVMRRKWRELLLLGSAFLDMLQGLTTLRLFGEAAQGVRLMGQLSEAHRQSTMGVMRIAFLTTAVLEFFSSLAIAMVAVFCGTRLLNAHMTFEPAFFVLLLAPEFFAPLRAFSASYHARQNAESAFEPLMRIMAMPELRVTSSADDSATAPNGQPLAGPGSLKNVFVRHVSVAYGAPGTQPDVLADASALFPAGQLSVITGPSGSGKTTLVRLLLGMMVPREGTVGATSVTGAILSPAQLSIGWVPQQPFLLAASVAENLRLANPDATTPQLEEAVRLAGATSFINALPGGLDYVLGERGAPLSAGQIRRLALARALLRNPAVLLFDEPTADLDRASAQQVVKAMQQAIPGRVTIAISHRSDVMAIAGPIVHLENGTVSEVATAGEMS
ncbi:thiol reductant ABC exporter subunit CydD [Formicincola oecophyllae]|uniref:Thiol reductant ABC exporter subunit CydD n=1 Tax=Formicincola oecophyllae TaxID=2558361 RepID=A0A4Y6UB51_9PROT|nr:thiol reductant ABC exporter subunit CydD [Formicincola oecophyllae]QDH13345.1 thiol reductant ABC exporter subunit CydD [Formicincola oecophyllae]